MTKIEIVQDAGIAITYDGEVIHLPAQVILAAADAYRESVIGPISAPPPPPRPPKRVGRP